MAAFLVFQVANLNGKDNTFTLKDSLFKDIQKDWPGYTEGDQQLLKRILVRYVTAFPLGRSLASAIQRLQKICKLSTS